MTNLEVGNEVAHVEWESKYMEYWEYAHVSNPPQFKYDVRSLYQKMISLGGLCGNGSFLGLFSF